MAWNRYVNANEANEQVMKEFFGVSQEEVEYRRKQRKALGDFSKPHKLMKRKKYNKGEAKIPKKILRSRRNANWLKEEERGVVRRRRKTYKEGEKRRTRKSQEKNENRLTRPSKGHIQPVEWKGKADGRKAQRRRKIGKQLADRKEP